MRLYGEANPAPNPRRVRIFLAEKGASLEEVRVPLRERAHKAEAFLRRNSLGQVPVLELDDGSHISESVSICRYLDETLPGPSLFGGEPRGRAEVDMWIRRVEWQLMAPVGQFWRHAHPLTRTLVEQHVAFGESNRPRVAAAYRWLEGEIGGRPFLAGPGYSMADIVLLTTVDFATFVGLEVPEDCAAVRDWRARASARPSAAA